MTTSAALRPAIHVARRQLRIRSSTLQHHPKITTPSSCSSLQQKYAPRRSYSSTKSTDNAVRIVEVGPRDGLQNEKKSIPVETKIELVERLAQTGLTYIEAGSFVSPKWVPQMNNSAGILSHLLSTASSKPPAVPQMTYSFLAPNRKGVDNAMATLEAHPGTYVTQTESQAGLSSSTKPALELAVFAAATESFSQKNLNCDIATSLERFREVIQGAKQAGLRARAYISVVLGCPFEGAEVDPHKVAEIATSFLEMGADEIALGDTTGMGTAPRTQRLLRCLASAGIRPEDLALHLHDTYGQALVNAAVALEHGIRTFDSAVGGLGGCPYSPGATGNVATENMVYFLESLGMDTGVDLDQVSDIGQWITGEIGKANDSSVGKAVIGARG